MSAPVRRHRSTLMAGSTITSRACAAVISGRRAVVVIDARIADRADELAGIDAVLPLSTDTVDAADISELSGRLRAHRAEVVVAIGGGGAIDAATVASLGVTAPRILEWALARAERSPVVTLPAGALPSVDIVAVPTTVGTSAESNAVAIVRTADGASLLRGEALRPRYAVLDDAQYRSLPDQDVRSGCLEALLRLAGVSTARPAHPRGLAHAVALARALLALGDESLTDATRLRIARCSAATQRTAALRGRAPFSPRHWYLAHEVSFVARATKMRATASVVGRVWHRIENGDTRWGSREPLETFWREVVRGMRLPLAPAAGIEVLIARWALPLAPEPDTVALAAMASRVERRWGGRGPALPGLAAPDVCNVLEGARWDPPRTRGAATSLRVPTSTDETRGGDE